MCLADVDTCFASFRSVFLLTKCEKSSEYAHVFLQNLQQTFRGKKSSHTQMNSLEHNCFGFLLMTTTQSLDHIKVMHHVGC